MQVTDEHRERAQRLMAVGPLSAYCSYLLAVDEIYVDDAPVGPCPTWHSAVGPENVKAYVVPDGDVTVADDHTGEEVSMDRGSAYELAFALLALLGLSSPASSGESA